MRGNMADATGARALTSAEQTPIRPLSGRVAVVTGGGEPWGRAVALVLGEAGMRVCILGSDVAALRGTAAAAGPDARMLYLPCDLGSLSEVAGAADFIARFDRPVDVLVHAADVHVRHGVIAGDVADLDEQYLVNLRGPYLVTQHLMPQLRQGPGQVVFLQPEDSGCGAPDTQYAMSRAGLDILAAGLRDEVAAAGIRVTTVRATTTCEPGDIADCVLGALEMPDRVELTELRLRARATAF
jgi:NAD(P)-dependent dehydrogenase (short-subunit alcohol dehydrogenase family)